MIFTQLLVNGLIAGSIYALVACGFSLIYGTNRFMHFAHGSCVVAGAYLLYSFFSLLKFQFWAASLLTILFAGILGIVMYRLIYLPLQRKKASSVVLLIASIGILILAQNLIQMIYGADVKTISLFGTKVGYHLLGAFIKPLQIVLILISVLLFVGLYFFMKKTALGRDMRAVSDNPELASITGINPQRIADYSFFIGTCLAGVAGILIGLEQNLYPPMGIMLMVKGFSGAVIGSIASVPGSILGAYVLGLAENFGIWFLPSGYKDAIAFVLLFLFLLIKPEGLLGDKK